MTDWDAVIADPQYAGRRVFSVTLDGKRYWVKRSTKDYKNLYQVVLYPSFSALRDEARAMKALRLRGMPVPTVVYETSRFLVLTDVGECLQRHLQQGDEDLRARRILQVADLLSEMHGKRGWHGNAALRNFTLHNEQLGMIDFENTAHRWCTVNVRQAFDIWQVLNSIAKYTERKPLATTFLARYGSKSRALLYLRLMAWSLSPIYVLLAPFSKYLKREIRNAVFSVGTLLAH